MLNVDQVIELAYQRLAAEAGPEGIRRRDAVKIIADELIELAERGEVELPGDWAPVVERELRELDDHDRKHQPDRLRIARDALADATILGTLDPLLDEVCVVGGGVRRTYRNVTTTDLVGIIQRKTRHAHHAAAAADVTAELAGDLIAEMQRRGVDLLGELYP